MNLKDFQHLCMETAKYPRIGNNIDYPALGLAGEAGEVCNKVKKVMRDCGGTLTEEYRQSIASEVGDVLWYCAAVAHELTIPLDEIAANVLAKLASRAERGTITGNGDTR